MSEEYQVPKVDLKILSIPTNCPGPDIVPIFYQINSGKALANAQILSVRCHRGDLCPISDCDYRNITSIENKKPSIVDRPPEPCSLSQIDSVITYHRHPQDKEEILTVICRNSGCQSPDCRYKDITNIK
jgi:hypothetical protein